MAPRILRVTKAASDAATRAEIPSTEASAQNRIPVEFPSTVWNAARRPWTAAERTTSAVAGPGNNDSSTATPRNEIRVDSTAQRVPVLATLEVQIRPAESDFRTPWPR